MGAFLKTFIICLVLALSFLFYKFVGNDSFSPSLNLSGSNPIFSVSNDSKHDNETIDAEPIDTTVDAPDTTTENAQNENADKNKFTHTCYFYSASGKLIPVKRVVDVPLTLENTIILLLKGPLIPESKGGIYSEIPANVDLINVKRGNDSVIINLTSNFGNGGGSESIENRLKQLTKTVKNIVPNKNIYLYINGSEVEYLGGEGVYVKQPLE